MFDFCWTDVAICLIWCQCSRF